MNSKCVLNSVSQWRELYGDNGLGHKGWANIMKGEGLADVLVTRRLVRNLYDY